MGNMEEGCGEIEIRGGCYKTEVMKCQFFGGTRGILMGVLMKFVGGDLEILLGACCVRSVCMGI